MVGGAEVQFRKIMIIGLEIIIESGPRKGTRHSGGDTSLQVSIARRIHSKEREREYFNGKLNEREERITAVICRGVEKAN